MNWHSISAAEALAQLNVNQKQGLTGQSAAQRQKKYGKNKLAEKKPKSLFLRFLEQFSDFMVIVLLIAAAISFFTARISGDGDYIDSIIILLIVIINAITGVVQESKAEKAIAALKKLSAPHARVIRNSKPAEIASEDLVPGDILLLEAGDFVPADARLLEAVNLKAEESALTGESLSVEKNASARCPEAAPLGDRKNMVFSSSTITAGHGTCVVTSTGMETQVGRIAHMINQEDSPQTPLQQKLAQTGKYLGIGALIICLVIFLLGLMESVPPLEMFMISISLAVAAIPEGLPAVVTIVLSIGVTKMAKRQAIIRNLSAVETLGCTQVICSDKTGTLTQNKMTVVNHELAAPEEKLLAGMALCSDAKWDEEAGEAVGEPTECALVNDAAKMGMKGLDEEHPRVGEAPFDSGRKMMSVVVEEADGNFEQYTKGAPDVVVGLCTQVYDGDKIVPMTDERREQILAANKAMADQALRVLALASRTYTEKPADFAAEALENNLVFCGLSGMIDPERPEVAPAIEEAHGAGIRTVMITGDHIDTAVAIAKNLGIVEDRSQAITGAEIDKMSEEELDQNIEKYGVYARVQPEHKTRIVEAWKSKNKIVAMTGDGVNDAPSIKHANIGIGMGITGTDVTKNVADMVLADDNFATIINACEEGRRIYDNIRKVIQFLLSANLAEVFSVFAATLMGFTLFQPIQLLWVNLVTDCFPALALGMEEAEGDVMKRKPRNATDGVFAGNMGLDTVVQGLIITVLVLASFFCGVYFDLGVIDLSKLATSMADEEGVMMAFITLNMVEIFHCFNMRSRRASIFHMKKQNKWLWGAAFLALVLTLVVVEVDALSMIFFGVEHLEPKGMITALALGFLIIPLVEIYKAIMRAVEKE